MNRTYHFQVDNGLFIAEHYLDKDYRDIQVEDIGRLADSLNDVIFDYNHLDRTNTNNQIRASISSMTSANSCLTQPSQKDDPERFKSFIKDTLIGNIGHEISCTICGEKRIKANRIDSEILPVTSIIAGAPSDKTFRNGGNNLNYNIVCPVCMALGMFSILNVRHRNFPILYLTDSDDLMRHYTKEAQVAIDLALNVKTQDTLKLKDDIEMLENLIGGGGLYDSANYINTYRFSLMPRDPFCKEVQIQKGTIEFIKDIQNQGLYDQVIKFSLQKSIVEGWDALLTLKYRNISDMNLDFYKMLKETYMTEKDILLVESYADKLERINYSRALKDLKKIKNPYIEIREFFKKYNVADDLREINYIIKKAYKFTDYLIIEMNIRGRD